MCIFVCICTHICIERDRENERGKLMNDKELVCPAAKNAFSETQENWWCIIPFKAHELSSTEANGQHHRREDKVFHNLTDDPSHQGISPPHSKL